MAKVYLTPDDQNNLVGSFYSDADYISKKMKEGEIYLADIKKPRNPMFHKKFMALVALTLDNLPENFVMKPPGGREVPVNTRNQMLTQLKFMVGHVKTEINGLTGVVSFVPDSISFAAMDDDAFKTFYDLAIDKILENFLIGSSQKEIDKQIPNYL